MNYATDLSDAEWVIIEPFLPPAKSGGRKRTTDIRIVCNAIFYLMKTGCQWCMLPKDFPPYSTVYFYYRRWQKSGIGETINRALIPLVREKAGKSPNPTSLAVDSQSVKTTEKRGDVYGFDGGKKVKGRRRHIVVDSLGLVMQAIVTEGNGGERIGAAYALMTLKEQWTEMVSHVERIFADAGYQGDKFGLCMWLLLQAKVEILARVSQLFEVIPKRWVVERTFAWLNGCRRLSKDYEKLVEVSESMIYTAMIRLMLRRISSS